MSRRYFSTLTPRSSCYPWGIEQAKLYKQPQWTAEERCADCGRDQPCYYLRSGVCYGCALDEYSALFKRYRDHKTILNPDGEMPKLKYWQLSYAENGARYFGMGVPCHYGPHSHDVDPITNKCRGCNAETGRANYTAPQQVAMGLGLAMGYDVAKKEGWRLYHTGEPCTRGHEGWRYVNSRQCYDCLRGEPEVPDLALSSTSADMAMARDNPTMMVSKADAAMLGFALYRTGEECRRGHRSWRYVSTGACAECLGRI